MLRERDRPGGANIGLIDLTARYALDNGFHVVVEGILCAARYGTMLHDLVRAHQGVTRCYYLHVPFEETVLRHATKPDAEYPSSTSPRTICATGTGRWTCCPTPWRP